MHVYAIVDQLGIETPRFRATLREAQEVCKAESPIFRPDMRILLVDIATNKDSLVWMLNNPTGFNAELLTEGALRIFTITRRGGLKELK